MKKMMNQFNILLARVVAWCESGIEEAEEHIKQNDSSVYYTSY
jgi:hypothetical protein